MELPELKKPSRIDLITDSISFARELSVDLATREYPPTESEIHSAVKIMNQHLRGVKGDVPAIIKADTAYLNLPYDKMDVEFLSDAAIEQAKIEKALMRGRIESFHWLGSQAMTAFGVHLFGVDLIEPERRFLTTAFVPVEAISSQLAAR
jgi:hypothetical protein